MTAISGRMLPALGLLFFATPMAEANSEFQYYINGGKITIAGYSGTPAGTLVIPSSINGIPVTEIGDGAFSNSFNNYDLLTGVSIPATVTKIGNSAFFLCHGITQITLPTSLTQIGSSAFCFTGLSSVTIPQSVTLIGSGAFSDCRNLTSIHVSSSNASYGSINGVLYNKTRTTLILYPPARTGTFSIPSSVTSITSGAFASATALTAVNIPTSVTSIGSTAFASCSRLSSVSIPASVTSIGSGAFRDCIGIASIHVDPANPAYSSVGGVLFNHDQSALIQCPAGRTDGFNIPSSCTAIGESAFAGCAGLWAVTIPEGVGSIGTRAFENCTSLNYAELPAGVTTIGERAFSGCTSLVNMKIPPGITTIGSYTFSQCASLQEIVIPPDVMAIGDSAFSNCISLTTATLLDGLASIGDSAFSRCRNLQSISVPESVTTIGSSAFSGCTSLASAEFHGGLTTVGSYAFSNCNSLQTISIPESVISIGPSAFGYCSQLTGIDVDPGNLTYSSLDGVLLNKAQTSLIQFPAGRIGAYEIPAGVISIVDSAFEGCRSLTHATMGDDLVSIGSNAFSNCTGLSEIALGTGVTSIEFAAFKACEGLEQVNIGPNVTSIGNFAFNGCNNLASIEVDAANASFSSLGGILYNKTQSTLIECPGGLAGTVNIPAGVTTMQTNAFSNSRNLTAIHVDPANSAFSSIDGILLNKIQTTLIRCPIGKSGIAHIPASVTSMASSVFDGCRDITAYEVDPSNASYRSLDGLLYNKAGTTLLRCPFDKSGSVTLSATVTGIVEGVFSDCRFLTAIDVDPANPVFSSVDGVLYNKSRSLLIQFPGGKTGYAIIPASVTSLGWHAFDERDDLSGLVFLGNSPFTIFFSFDDSVPVQHFEGAIGFSPSTWSSWTILNMGAQSPVKLWLLANGFPYDSNLTSDINGDGVSFLMAYALDLNPGENLASSMPQAGFGGGFLSITYYSASAGITYRVETSGDLKIWTTQGISISSPNPGGYRTASVPVTGTQRYLRLVVSE